MLTEQQRNQLDWEKTDRLLPVIVQHAVSGEVLMLGYMNQEALAVTEQSGKVTFFSRTKQRLWTKGESSGHFLNVVSITPDCDNDTLLILANPIGPTCHLGNTSCFHPASSDWGFLYQLEQLLAERKNASPDSSYTASLYASGTKRIAQKVGEEGVETALAATVNDREELTNEASDLIYHLLVLLQDQDLDLSKVIGRLRERHQKVSLFTGKKKPPGVNLGGFFYTSNVGIIPSIRYGTRLLCRYVCRCEHRSSHAAPGSGWQAEPLNGSCRSKRLPQRRSA